MSHLDDDTIEAIARWLEAAAVHGKPWQLRRLAALLRSGQWATMPAVRSDTAVLLARVDDKLARRIPISSWSGPEVAVWTAREARRNTLADAEARRTERMVSAIEAYANAPAPEA